MPRGIMKYWYFQVSLPEELKSSLFLVGFK